ncbi:MAG: tetratricopeptide repeat protein [Parvularcula sp.]|nr:tetratricopeptide repeat protein [Parvularcula sp.]
MWTFLLIAFLAAQPQAEAAEAYGLERCAATEGPEVGVGILCDRARSAIDQRELSVARRLSDTAAALAPSHPGVWIVKAEVARASRQLNEARGHFEKAASLEPGNPAILVAMGDFEAAEGNVRGAAALYEQAAEIDVDLPGLAERLEAVSDLPAASEI